MNKWLKFLVIPLLIAIVGAVFYNKVYVVKSTFSVIKPSKGELEVGVRGIGNVDAKNIYAITAQTGGKIEEIFFDEGMWVKKGDLLLSIDAVDLPMQSDETKLSLKKAQYEENALKSNLDSLEAQKKLIEATYNRYAKLLEQKFASQAEFDKAKSDLQNIEAQMNAAKAQIASSKSEQLRLQKSIEAIDEKLKRLKIYAPIDGYIVSKEAEKASYVLASSTIFKIVDPKTLWVKVNIDERLSNQVKLGQKAYIKLRSQPQNAIEGAIERIVAMSNLVTLEREVAVNFKNIPTPFYINEQAEVNIVVARHKDVIKIPLRLIAMKEGKKGVWTADQNNAHFKEISVLAQNDDEAAIASGIEADTELLIYNSSNKPLSEGMKIFR